MKKYYLFEKHIAGGNSFRKYTLGELKEYFKPVDVDGICLSEEEFEIWKDIEDVKDLKDFIENYVNDNCGEHYHDYYIEEVL